MPVKTFLSTLEPARKEILSAMHEIIIENDKTVEASIGEMMGKEMIIYNANNSFKYALASVKNHMSLHVLPMYGSPEIYNKYQLLFDKASFQKGCINFKNAEEMPLTVLKDLMSDTSKIDLVAIRNAYLQNKKAAKKAAAPKKK